MLVDRNGQVVYSHGRTDAYLARPSWEPTRDLISLAREDLRTTLRDAMRAAAEEDREVSVDARSAPDDAPRSVTLTVSPLRPAGADGLFVVTFEEPEAAAGRAIEPPAAAGGAERAGPAEAGRQTIEQLSAVNARLRRKVEELEAAAQAANAAQHHLHGIFDAVRHPLLVLDPDLQVRSANAPFYETFEIDPAETEGTPIDELGQGQWDIPGLRRQLFEVLPRDKAFDDFEVEHDFVGLGHRAMLLNARQIDELRMILLSIEDVTERKRWEERQQMLLGELSHRVKNMLATVQAIASQTARTAPDLQAFQRAFGDRLGALDAAHTLLIDGQWQSVRLHAVVAVPLKAYEAEDGERVHITGEDFALTPKAALAVSMVMNELATNAAKYGALSTPSGRVDIAMGLARSDLGQVVAITWRESGGPEVEPPSDPGFGLTLVERSITHELDGETRVDFDPDGLRCEILIPYNPENIQTG